MAHSRLVPGTVAGGAGLAVLGARVNASNLVVEANTMHSFESSPGVTAAGAGVLVAGGSLLTLADSAVVRNVAVFGDGAGIGVVEASRVAGSNTTRVQGNTAYGCGAGLALHDGAQASGLVVRENAASGALAHGTSDSHVAGGGGVCGASGAAVVLGCVIEHNKAVEAGGGGVMVRPGATLSLLESSVRGNTAPGGGGVFVARRGTLRGWIDPLPVLLPTLWNATRVTGNSASRKLALGEVLWSSPLVGCGGGVLCDGCALVAGLVVADNQAVSGGGAAVGSTAHPAPVSRLSTCLVVKNNAAEAGGGVAVVLNATVVLQSVRVADNVAAVMGGGIWAKRSVVLFDSVQSDSSSVGATVTGNHAIRGGGVAIEQAVLAPMTPTVHMLVDGNSAGKGGGIHVWGQHARNPANITGVKLSRNVASRMGGGVYVSGNLTAGVAARAAPVGAVLSHLDIDGCSAGEAGGAAYFHSTSVRVTSVRARRCHASEGGAFAINASSVAAVSVNLTGSTARNGAGAAAWNSRLLGLDVLLHGNVALVSGGGVASFGGTTVAGVTVDACTSHAGAGYVVNAGSVLRLHRCRIAHCVAEPASVAALAEPPRGGAVAVMRGGVAILAATELVSCTSAASGGGLHVAGNATVSGSSTIQDNRAGLYGGGAVVTDGGWMRLEASVVRDNVATQGGGAVAVLTQSHVEIHTSVFRNNAVAPPVKGA